MCRAEPCIKPPRLIAALSNRRGRTHEYSSNPALSFPSGRSLTDKRLSQSPQQYATPGGRTRLARRSLASPRKQRWDPARSTQNPTQLPTETRKTPLQAERPGHEALERATGNGRWPLANALARHLHRPPWWGSRPAGCHQTASYQRRWSHQCGYSLRLVQLKGHPHQRPHSDPPHIRLQPLAPLSLQVSATKATSKSGPIAAAFTGE